MRTTGLFMIQFLRAMTETYGLLTGVAVKDLRRTATDALGQGNLGGCAVIEKDLINGVHTSEAWLNRKTFGAATPSIFHGGR